MYDGMLAETVAVTGDGGDLIAAYLARPLAPGPMGGVVIAHDGAVVHPGVASLLQRVEGDAGVDGPSH